MASGISGDMVLESVNIDDFQANCNQERAFRVALKALPRRRSNRNVTSQQAIRSVRSCMH